MAAERSPLILVSTRAQYDQCVSSFGTESDTVSRMPATKPPVIASIICIHSAAISQHSLVARHCGGVSSDEKLARRHFAPSKT